MVSPIRRREAGVISPVAPADSAMAAGFVAELRRRGVLRALVAYFLIVFAHDEGRDAEAGTLCRKLKCQAP
jgi:hypothetical protein